MTDITEAVQRAKDCKAQLYNLKSNCPDDARGAELVYLYQLAAQAPAGLAVEVGIREAGSLVCWAAAREGRGTLAGVDVRELATVRPNLARYGLEVDLLFGGSQKAAEDLPDALAFCFIDADHGLPVYDDICAWVPKIMVNGIIAFHDYGTHKGVVKDAVDAWADIAANFLYLGRVGSTVAFKRLE